jgi:hypothetical protein
MLVLIITHYYSIIRNDYSFSFLLKKPYSLHSGGVHEVEGVEGARAENQRAGTLKQLLLLLLVL